MSKGKRLFKKHKLSMMLLVCLGITVIVAAYFFNAPSATAESEEIFISHGYATGNEFPYTVSSEPRGSEANPFVILEIVPRLEVAEFGYLIAGCEPLDIDKMLYDDVGLTTIKSYGSANISYQTAEKFDLDKEKDNPGKWKYVDWQTKTAAGYYERVESGAGLFIQKKDATGNSVEGMNKVERGGEFVWITDSNTGALESEKDWNAPNVGDRIYTTRTDYYYINYNYATYENKNLVLKNCLGLSDEEIADFHVVYKAIQPTELNKNLKWIDRADLFYVNPKSHLAGSAKLWGTYNKEGISDSSYTPVQEANFTNPEDLSWDATVGIFKKVTLDQEFAPIILDVTVYEKYIAQDTFEGSVRPYQFGYDEWGKETSYVTDTCKGGSNNIWKLSLMLRTMDPVKFYNMYLNDNTENGGEYEEPLITATTMNGRTTGTYKKQPGEKEKVYWGSLTFMPTKLDGSQAFFQDWKDGEGWDVYNTNPVFQNGGWSVSDRVFTYNGDMSLSANFDTDNIKYDPLLTKPLFDWLGSSSGAASSGDAIKFLLADKSKEKQYYEGPITVLELQPCYDFSLTVAQLRKMLPSFPGSIRIERQTTAEFNSKIEDINTEYDLIYMGLNYGKYNTGKVTLPNGDSKVLPLYNDAKLNGKIYLHVGDEFLSAESSTLVSVKWLNNGTTVRGSGNDITSSKREKLVDFIDARNPIIVQGDLYNVAVESTASVAKVLVDQTSNVYQFMIQSVEREKREQVVKATSAKLDTTVREYLSVPRPVINASVIPKEYIGDSSNGTIDSGQYLSSRELGFSFVIDETVSQEASKEKYRVYLYIDANRDGILDTEAKQVYPSEGGFYTAGEPISIRYKLNDELLGALPWKLEVINVEYPKMRTSLSGFSAIKRANSEKVDIKILQVNQNPESKASTLNLHDNIVSEGLFEKYIRNLNDYNITFETITIKEFEERFDSSKLGGRKFDNTDQITKALTDQLTYQYDMLIFGFSDYYDNISNVNGALDNVKYFIDCEHSVLFTHDVTSFNNNAAKSNAPGYNFNVSFRELLGMDRFGARLTEEERIQNEKDKATSPYQEETYEDIHGYTYEAMKRLGHTTKNTYGIFKDMKFAFSNDYSTKVSKLNDGQITRYPYDIPEIINVAQTHGQYYQLDLENDDITVWYTLLDQSAGTMYNVSPNDGANNYYIYNKGNITYSGVGHSTVDGSPSRPGSVDEVKLFVNTMVAAYRNGIKAPTITITNEDSYKSTYNEYFVYVNDDNHSEYVEEEYFYIEFTPYDSNIISPYIDVLAVTEDGEYELEIVDDKGKSMEKDDNGYVELQSEKTYYAKWPKVFIGDEGKVDVNFIAINKKGIYGGSIAHVLRRGLFDLD